MKRTLGVAAALAFTLATPVSSRALSADVEIYGTLIPFLDSIRTSGPTGDGLSPETGGASMVPAASYGTSLRPRLRLTSGTSNLGFRGGLAFNEDLKIVWQIESAVSPDGDPPNLLAARNSRLGLASKYGVLFFGSWDTPYKHAILTVGALRGLSPFDNALTANPGFNVPGTTTQTGRSNGKADAAFNRRQGNSIQYWSPNLFGFSARLAYGLDEGTTQRSSTASDTRPYVLSGMLSFVRGPIEVRYSYEMHHDYFGLSQLGGSAAATLTNTSSLDQGHEVIVVLSAPTGTKASLIFERLSYRNSDTTESAIDTYTRYAGLGLLQQRFGRHQVWASLGLAADGSCTRVGGGATTTNGLGAKQWAIGYSFSPSPSADLFAAYYETDNGRSASYGPFPPAGTVAPGAAVRGFGVGVLYTFAHSWSTEK